MELKWVIKLLWSAEFSYFWVRFTLFPHGLYILTFGAWHRNFGQSIVGADIAQKLICLRRYVLISLAHTRNFLTFIEIILGSLTNVFSEAAHFFMVFPPGTSRPYRRLDIFQLLQYFLYKCKIELEIRNSDIWLTLLPSFIRFISCFLATTLSDPRIIYGLNWEPVMFSIEEFS